MAASLAVRGQRRSPSRSTAVQQASDLHRLLPEQGLEAACDLLGCKRSKSIFQDHNMPLTWENVELRGVEPLTSCMPCNKSNAPAWASMAATWPSCTQECP